MAMETNPDPVTRVVRVGGLGGGLGGMEVGHHRCDYCWQIFPVKVQLWKHLMTHGRWDRVKVEKVGEDEGEGDPLGVVVKVCGTVNHTYNTVVERFLLYHSRRSRPPLKSAVKQQRRRMIHWPSESR